MRLPLPSAWIAAPVLAATVLLPGDWRTMAALVAIIVLGVPHGALDGEVARDALRPRLGRLWFPVFAVPYLALSAAVLLAWHAAPMATLAGFLAASVWHFGTEEAPAAPWPEQLLRGGLPVAVPTLLHPSGTAAIFATVTGRAMEQPPPWMVAGAVLWGALALAWLCRRAAARRWAGLGTPALLLAGFAILPPLPAFAIYFVCVHAPAHVRNLIGEGRAARVRDARSAALRAMPLFAMTLVLGAALWPLYGGPAPARLLALTLQGLAALTLPHLLLESGMNAADRARPRAKHA